MNFIKFWVWSPLYVMILLITYFDIMLIYIFRDPDTTEKVWLIVHHLLMLVVIYLIFKTSTTKPGTPTYFYTEDDPLVDLRPICKHCFLKKPLRCHHCDSCGKCILRMDHHEYWLNNCIGQNNYKYFFCLIFYMTVTLEFYICIYLIKIIESPPNGAIDTYFIIFTVPLSISLNLLLIPTLAIHIRLILYNQTSVEFFEKKQEHHDKGVIANCKELLGPGCWLIPI
ncbi:unnamed protein product (macronuclear) [Paramecium tetraurelia]|uniref:Palmitoyltransferase n=1 Tax=Paramecium tetraurelia TaxID=5888 RepID=A0CYK7_PARTE|nr:uncharacterized protein GSPATT00011475001 [Paramecium tetraurelia]CAK75874.1 unnamed protein product [Paramecium tetraurelia]|eukprot:XP_001443271.1 hypothetical protein (macronuclear) [Paramecium tetraurelia strain d4-2]